MMEKHMKTKSYTKDELYKILFTIESDRPHILQSFVEVVNQELYFYNREREYIEFVNYRLKTKLIDFDRLLATTLTDKDVWELIESIWTLTERHYEEKEEWDFLFRARPKTPSLTKTLPYEFTVYRAGDDKGYSWTLDPKTARWFWKRNNLKDSKAPNDIWTLKVRKEQVYFYTNERKEEEVVLDPYYVLYVTKERVKPIKLSEKEIEKIISAL